MRPSENRSSSLKQIAYARRLFNADGMSKKQIALDVGYSPSVANNATNLIENQQGFKNAMIQLAADSNNLVLAAMEEFKLRGFKDFSNSELTKALSAITTAWAKFNEPLMEKDLDSGGKTNRLRTIIHQQIENQVINTSPEVIDNPVDRALPAEWVIQEGEDETSGDPMDF